LTGYTHRKISHDGLVHQTRFVPEKKVKVIEDRDEIVLDEIIIH